MKSLAALVAGLSLSLSLFSGPAFANSNETEGAKGLFFEQLDHPGSNLNTGIQYWIELHHNGQTIHATNKTTFRTGDRIRFHLRPNIDGYAYIMLKSGSRGEQAVLFPEKDRNEDNKITRGKEIVLPNDGMLGFDDVPGTEKLTLVVSRKPIDTDSYLNGGSHESAPLVAMASCGSKDLVPTQVYVAYLPPAAASASSEAAKNPTAAKQNPSTSKIATKTPAPASVPTSSESSKKTGKNSSGNASSSGTNSGSAKDEGSTGSQSTTTKKMKNPRHAIASSSAKDKDNAHPLHVSMKTDDSSQVVHRDSDSGSNSGLVTVVFKDPNAVLSADISLEHLKE
ncbi:MAG TPA: DUF4384 domain-containing protein [Oculatellaceae cyanobacterium]